MIEIDSYEYIAELNVSEIRTEEDVSRIRQALESQYCVEEGVTNKRKDGYFANFDVSISGTELTPHYLTRCMVNLIWETVDYPVYVSCETRMEVFDSFEYSKADYDVYKRSQTGE